MRQLGAATLAVLTASLIASVAFAASNTSFPHVRAGFGSEITFGSGVIAGAPYFPRTAVIAWNSRWNSLTLYLLRQEAVTCGTLRKQIAKPGHLIQVHVTGKPHVSVGRPATNPQVAFVTTAANPDLPQDVAGLKSGAQLTFTRVDSFPGGVWHGSFRVPQRTYGDGKVYGYSGTFAAKWCELRG